MFEATLVSEAPGESVFCEIQVKHCPWRIFTHTLYVFVGVECFQPLNRLPARNDPFLLFLLIQSPRLFLALVDPVSTIQAVIYFA